MKNLSTSVNKNTLILLFFIFSSIITLAKIEDRFSIPVDFKNTPSEIKTELVVPAIPCNFSSFYRQLVPVIHQADFSAGHLDCFSIHTLLLQYYNSQIIYQIKFNEHFFISANRIVITIQKNNIPHQSSDDHSSKLG